MAIWQFQCNIIPKRTNVEQLSLDRILSWEGVTQPAYPITFLKREGTWSSDIAQFGKSDETCLKFVFDNGTLREIECRLDLRNLTKSTLAHLLEYIENNNAMVWINGQVYSPTMEKIVEVMKQSEANQFCKNPKEYLLNKKVTLE